MTLESWKRDFTSKSDKVTSVLRDGVTRRCGSTADIGSLIGSLDGFAMDIIKEKDLAIEAMKIVEQIRTEEHSKVLSLFSQTTRASEFLKLITDGEYTEITFEPTDGSLQLRNSANEIVSSKKLSSGTNDQLLLSVRLSLAEHLLVLLLRH